MRPRLRLPRWPRAASLGDRGEPGGGRRNPGWFRWLLPAGVAEATIPLSPQLLLTLLPCGLALGLVILPIQGLSALGFLLQRQWQLGVPGLFDPLLPLGVACGTLTVLALAWGPLALGRGGGISGVEALQQQSPAPEERDLALLGLRGPAQLARLVLLAGTHLAGLAVGMESPAASFGASTLLALRRRLKVLQALPLPLAAAVGAGAGLAAAFRSPLLGVTYALEELSAERGLPLVLPTLLLGGVGSLVTSELGVPVRIQGAVEGAPPLILLPWALLLTLAAAVLGVFFLRLLLALTPRLQGLLRHHFLPTALAVALLLGLLAQLSGGLSLNDGSLALGPALAGQSTSPRWAVLPRLISPLLALAAGAPGGLMHDCMALGAVFSAALVHRLPPDQQAMLVAVGATAVFSAACRTPLFCAVFVFILQNNARLFPWLLLASALAAAIGTVCGGPTWNGFQRAGLEGLRPAADGR
jgi:H+/Cl- antiporter ClcA